MSKLREKIPGEMNAEQAYCFFDDIKDKNKNKLVKSKKRSRIKELMEELYNQPEKNQCNLKNGQKVLIIVKRQNKGRAAFYYFNNIEAPRKEILQAFAKATDIKYKERCNQRKKANEIIAQEALVYFDEVIEQDEKLTGTKKLLQMHKIFARLYAQKDENQCQTVDGIKPIVVQRVGVNNKILYCLNTSSNKNEVLRAFATWAGLTYRQEKENGWPLKQRKKNELTIRQSTKIFHNIPNLDGSFTKRDGAIKLGEWIEYIGKNNQLNNVMLPDGNREPLVMFKQSHSRPCWCLNTDDERIKPFVIKRLAEIMRAEVCMDNIRINNDNSAKILHKAMMTLVALSKSTAKMPEQKYFREYAEKIYQTINVGKELTLNVYISKISKKRN